MAEKNAPGSRKKPALTREDRLKAALKANLGRRKAQGRARATGQTDNGTPKAEQDKDI